VEIGILGPVEVRIEGRSAPLGGPKQRALLAVLALHANEPVPRDRLIDALWGERPPPSVDASLDAYLSRLRRVVGRERIVRRPGGYVLVLGTDELDLERFARLVANARATVARGDLAAGATLLRNALALWRGDPLGDVLYEPFANAAAVSLTERRLSATEELLDLELRLGQAAELVPELERLTREHSHRERLIGQLALALYRAGRQADALAAIRTARTHLSEALGLDPGPELRALELGILRHDPALAGPVTPPPPPVQRRLRRMPRQRAATVVAAAALGFVVLALPGPRAAREVDAATDRLLAVSEDPPRTAHAIALAAGPAAVVATGGSVWVADSAAGAVLRIEASSGAVADRVFVPGAADALATAPGALWVAATLGHRLTRVDLATGRTTQSVELGNVRVTALAFGGGRLWVADAARRALVELDPATGSLRRTLQLEVRPAAIAASSTGVWAADHDHGSVVEVDRRSGRVLATVAVGNGPAAVALDHGSLWVANSLDATVSRIDMRTGSVVATIAVGRDPAALAVDGASLWVANAGSGTVSRIDIARDAVASTLAVGGRPRAAAAANGRLWVGSAGRDDAHRGGTLRIVTTQSFPSVDPAFFESAAGFQFTRLSYDTLVSFAAAPGSAGFRLVPDLAAALPAMSAGGTRYTFRLRSGIHYSDGRPLRAADFRRGVERLFRAESRGVDYYTGLVGTEQCLRRPARCELGRGILTDEATRTVVFRLRAPDPDFLFKLTVAGFGAPIPAGIPDRDMRLAAIPGTGPYRVEEATGAQIRFGRNRGFHEWSAEAQPDGAPDAIVWRLGVPDATAVHDVEAGRADWLYGTIAPARLRALELRLPAQLHRNASFAVDFIPLNTRQPPFDDVRVRQALNLAIDRRRVARMYGGGAIAVPTCQPLAPGLPGYRPYCPYTRRPGSAGTWKAPDLARARRLVAASGTQGMRVEVWGASDLPYVPRGLTSYVASVVRMLGYRVTVRSVPYDTFTPALRSQLPLTTDGDWLPDYPAPSAYLPGFFACDGSRNRAHRFCDPKLDIRMQAAAALQTRSPGASAALWTSIDHELVDRAAWVPTVNLLVNDFVSKRVRNYQYQPVWGFMPARAWLR
jgi:peptide/nickel transport system substrate-binding protein